MSTHQFEDGMRGAARGMTTTAIAGLFLAVGLLAGCTSKSAVAEPGGFGPVVEVPAGSFVVQWQRDLPMGRTPISKLFVGEDKVFACTTDNQCYWINRSSGFTTALVPVAKPNDQLFAPVMLPDRVVFPSTSRVYVFDRHATLMLGPGGTTHIALRFAMSSPAVGYGKTLYVGLDHVNGGWLTAIDTHVPPYDVAPPWEIMTNGQISAAPAFFRRTIAPASPDGKTPAMYEDEVYAGSRDGGVYAVNADNRQPLWTNLDRGVFATGGEILADLKADKEGVYVASTDGKLYCLNADSGRVNWTYYAGRRMVRTSSPVVTADSIYMYVPNVGVVAIDKTSKEEIRHHRWAVAEGRQYLASDSRNVYLRTADNHILAVDKQTGQVQFRSRRNDFALFAVDEAARDGVIYAMTAGGTVCAIKPVVAPGGVGEVVMAN